MMLRRLTAVLLTALLLVPASAAAAQGSRYSDVPSGDWWGVRH